jgi:hypothetical protein
MDSTHVHNLPPNLLFVHVPINEIEQFDKSDRLIHDRCMVGDSRHGSRGEQPIRLKHPGAARKSQSP